MSSTPKKTGSVSDEKSAPPPVINIEDVDDEDDVMILPPLPPDGGYGWVVMIAACLCSVIVDGLCFSFGIFFTEFINTFESTNAKTSFVGSLVPGMYLGMGPIASALSNKYGFRPVTMFGGVIAGLSFFASTFSPSINWLIFLYGFCGGLGLGMAYLPSIGAVSFYFEKRRALATGVTVCGSGIGAFVFAPLSKFLLAYYGGWRPAYWIISGIVLNLIVLGALFRPLKARVIRKAKKVNGEGQTVGTKGTIMDRMIAEKQKRNRTISDSSLDGAVITKSNNIEKSNTDLHPICENKHENNANNGDALLPEPRSRTGSVLHYFGSAVQIAGGSQQDLQKRVMAEVARPMYKQDIMYMGSVKNLDEYKSQPDRETYIRSHTSLPAIDESEKQTCGAKMAPAIHVIKEMFDVSLLRSVMFLVVCLSSFLSMFGFFTPFFFITSYAVAQGIETNRATMLISLLGVFNTVSRIATGFFSDKPWANPLIIHNVALICAGVATCFAPVFTTYPLLIIYCGIFGCCIAAYICIRSILLVDLLGLEKLNNAFGLFLFCQGIASLIGSPLAGALFDYSDSFALSFLVGGLSIALAGVVTIPVRYIKRWEDNRNGKKNANAQRYSEVKVNGD